MKFKPIHLYEFVYCLILSTHVGVSKGKPLDYEDVADLLPEIPRNKNDTMAAIVQDPVVQDAVHNAASNTSLNGLVVKKKVLIMPATNPSKVLSQQEQVLVVPPEHLEDVRRNITESKEAEIENNDFTSAENQSMFDDNLDEYTTERSESSPEYVSHDWRFHEGIYENSENSILKDDDLEQKLTFDVSTFSPKPTSTLDATQKISVPIVAVIKPADSGDDKLESSIVAILPNRAENNALTNQLDFFTENREKIEKDAQAYVDRSSIAVDPENWKFYSTSSKITRALRSSDETPMKEQETENSNTEKLLLTSLMLPSLKSVEPVLSSSNEHLKYPREVGDMDVAEDIIFRPLFRYRQEAQQRSRYRQDDNYYRRSSYQRYNPYQNYDYYPKRNYRYRSRNYDDYY